MLRISPSEDDAATVLLLEGKLLEPWVGEVERAVASASGRFAVQLDLSGLDYVDASGARLLARLRQRGVVLRLASPLVAGLMAAGAASRRTS
jgi:anti-anti-sigma regulatory factor